MNANAKLVSNAEAARHFTTDMEIAGRMVELHTHNQPHLDEPLSAMIIDNEADSAFFDIYAPDGVIDLGINGGTFDEHAQDASKSCSRLVAGALGIVPGDKRYERWKKFLRFVDITDREQGEVQPDDLAVVLKWMHRVWPDEQEENVNWALQGLYAKLFDGQNKNFECAYIGKLMLENGGKMEKGGIDPVSWNKRWRQALAGKKAAFKNALDEIRANHVHMVVRQVPGKLQSFKVVFCHSDNFRMAAALRSQPGMDADVAVVKNSFGCHVIQFGRYLPRSILDAVTFLVRHQEAAKRGRLVSKADLAELNTTGTSPMVPEWYKDDQIGALYNGSYSRPDITPSVLAPEQILNVICTVLARN